MNGPLAELIFSGEGGIFNYDPSGAPGHLEKTKLAHAQLGYGANNIRP